MAKRKPSRSRRGKVPAQRPVARPPRRPQASRVDAAAKGADTRVPRARRRDGSSAALWLYGGHAVQAALMNPQRHCRRLLVAQEWPAKRRQAIAELLDTRPGAPRLELVERQVLADLLPEGAVHQGIALLVEPLAARPIEDLFEAANAADRRRVIVALDQVTDPQNVGAILRTAAAFGAAGLLTTRSKAAPESGALAKAASGALERVPVVRAANLVRSLEAAKAAGYWCLGLAGDAEQTLAEADPGGPVVLVLGAEGGGLRRLTRETCDRLARLATRGPIVSLNVSNAAAVALYALLAGR